MYLKGLKMQGFKSFADKIELDFSQGITAIVGPNGSGKSNISDAVRWVLGEQSAKTLRGAKMEDVIFSGTELRSRLGFAEVTLELDNSDHHFPFDFDTITVTRKVFASGESQYILNGTPCRLKDIHEVFMDTGLGRDGYSMIGQGKIDELLSAKSEDRREIFEEAAGISKYRYRKEEAQRRLKHTDENLDRVEDIIGELEIQIGPLSKQAEKAKVYLGLRDALRLYDVNAALSVVEKSRGQRTELSEKIKVATEQLAATEQELTDADQAQEACYTEFERIDRETAAEEDALKALEESIVVGEREIEVLKNTVQGNLRLIERIIRETEELSASKTTSEQSVLDLRAEIKRLKEELSIILTEKEALREKLLSFDENREVKTDDLDRLKEEISALFEAISAYRIRLSNADLLEENLKTTIQKSEQDIKAKEDELEEQKKKIGNLGEEHAKTEILIQELSQKLDAEKIKERALEAELNSLQAQVNALQEQAEKKKTRLHLLSEMEQNFEGYNKSVRELMRLKGEGQLSGVHGPVSKLLHIKKTYATAVGVALGGAMQNLVVNREEDAKKAISHLKRIGAGRATFMPLNAVAGGLLDVSGLKKEPGYVGLASELCEYDSQYEGIVRNLLGRTVVVENTDCGIEMSRKHKQSLKIVTLEGEIFYPGGSIAGGSQQKGNQLLEREQEMADLHDEIDGLDKKLSELLKKKTAIESDILDIGQVQSELYEAMQEHKDAVLVLSRDREHQGLLLSSLEAVITAGRQAIEVYRNEFSGISKERKEAEDELARSEEEIQIKRQKVNELEESYEVFANKKQAISDSLMEKSFEETAKHREIEQAEEKIKALCEEIGQTETLITLRKDEMKEISDANDEHDRNAEEKAKENQIHQTEVTARKQVIQELLLKRQKQEQLLRSLQGEAGHTRETVYQLKTECDRLKHQLEKLDSEADSAISRLWDEYELTYSEASGMKQDLGSDSTISKQISSLRGKIRDLGNVNVDAIEELKTVEERYNFLTNQRDDLNKAKRDLLHIIQEMQTIMQKQFKEEFQKISRHFKTTFTELFGGGYADLRLEDEEHVLDCGIIINVQPPGKKLQNLSLLSGGERALSAIALLFAILRIKPTPFCFLDEIEAALDENNVYRYADFVKRFSRNTQFIIVTHRRGTMECADMIYGVTMQEKGVSKLLKLNLEEIESK